MAQYLKPDSSLGFVEDSAEIENLKFNNLRHTILGCMLGDFDEVGSYVVEPEIKKELIEMEKYIVQSYDNIELCKSVLKLDKQISFMVTFEGNRATLTLVEKLNYEANITLNSGTYSNINEYVLDMVETSGEINRNVIYQRWNIKPVQGNIIDIFNCDEETLNKYFGIVRRFKKLMISNKTLLEEEERLEEVESEYASSILDILTHYPKLEKSIIEFVTKTLKEKKDAISIQKPFFAKTFNEILENAVQQNIGELEEKEKIEFLNEKRNATLNLNIKRSNILEMEHNKINENQPALISLKVPESYLSRPVQDLADEFAGEYKQVEDRNKGLDNNLFKKTMQRNGEIYSTAERDKLIVVLTAKGLGDYIGVVKEKEQVKAQEPKKEEAKVVSPAPTKKAPAKEIGGSSAQKGNVKSNTNAAKSKSGSTQKAKSETTKKQGTTSQKQTKKQTEKTKEEVGLRYSDLVADTLNSSGGVSAKNVSKLQEKEREIAMALGVIKRTESLVARTNNTINTVQGASKDTTKLVTAVDNVDNVENALDPN